MHERAVDALRRVRIAQRCLVGGLGVGDPAEHGVGVAEHLRVARRERRALETFEQVDDLLGLVLVKVDARQAQAPDVLEVLVALGHHQLVEDIGCILVAILFHVQARHRELRLRRVRRVRVGAAKIGGNGLRSFEITLADVFRELLEQRRRFELRIQLAGLVIVDAE